MVDFCGKCMEIYHTGMAWVWERGTSKHIHFQFDVAIFAWIFLIHPETYIRFPYLPDFLCIRHIFLLNQRTVKETSLNGSFFHIFFPPKVEGLAIG